MRKILMITSALVIAMSSAAMAGSHGHKGNKAEAVSSSSEKPNKQRGHQNANPTGVENSSENSMHKDELKQKRMAERKARSGNHYIREHMQQSGSVSLDGYKNSDGMNPKVMKMLQRADVDGDGIVTKDEMVAIHKGRRKNQNEAFAIIQTALKDGREFTIQLSLTLVRQHVKLFHVRICR